MKLIVGLGNPGKEYENTRHNAGFRFIDTYAKTKNLTFNKEKFHGLYTEFIYNDEKIILLKPEKFMNLSGEVIRDFVKFFKIDLKDIFIICDDLDTEIGSFRLRYKGSSGGHNGLKNIEKHLHTSDYKRLKIGIGNKKEKDPIDYVIGKVTKEELEKMNSINAKAENIIDDYLTLDFDNLMNKYNPKRWYYELFR